jgi:hypothetical protein
MIFNALINELYSYFWISLSSLKISNTFMTDAILFWDIWGSDSKAAMLERKYIPIIKSDTSGLSNLFKRNSTTPARSRSHRRSKANSVSRKDRKEDDTGTISPRALVDIDINTVIQVSNSITNETNLEILLDTILRHLMNNTGATRAVIFVNEGPRLKLQKVLNIDGMVVLTNQDLELVAPLSLSNYVFRTQESKVFSEPPTDNYLVGDPYITAFKPISILCCPIKHQNIITGVIYLENRIQRGTFTSARVDLVKSLMASASISIANAQLSKKNEELSLALEKSKKEGQLLYNVETPLQKVFDAIKIVKERFDDDDPILKTLDVILSTLASDGLFSANLGEANDKDGKGIDLDTKNWIENSLLMTNTNSSAVRSRQNSRQNIAVKSSVIFEKSGEITLPNAPARIDEINAVLELSGCEKFDCFKLAEITENRPLYFLTTHLLAKYKLIDAFQLDHSYTHNFLQKIDSSYNKVPFHNRYYMIYYSIHATDVLQGAELLLLNTEISSHFTKLEIFSLCIASAIHDLDHPGINNNFLVQTQHPMAIMYNDAAVLESHHVARAFEITNIPGHNIFSSMSSDQYRQARKMIISIVLATDLAQHFQFISKFKGKTASASLKLEDDADRLLIMEMVVKCGDLGNPVKNFQTAKCWTHLVMEEFFAQVY